MKNLVLILAVAFTSALISCGGDSGDDMKVDCSGSDLSVSQVGTTDADCDSNGALEVSSTGGSGDVTFSINGTSFQSSGIFSVAAGSYTVTAKDENNCTATVNITVGTTGSIVLNDPTSTDSGCETTNGTITTSATGGTGEVTYSLNGGASQASGTFTNLAAGTYSVTVTDEENCSATKEHQVLTGISLEDDIMPLLLAQCTFSTCHNGDNGDDRNWTQKEDVLAKASIIKSRTQSGAMPRDPGVLTPEEVDLIACWVDDGALDN